MDFLDTYIDAIYGGVPRKMVDKYGNEFVDAVVTGAETVIPFNLADPLRPLLESFVQPDKPNPAVGSPDSKGKFYANEKFGYQSPDTYKDIYGAFPKAYVDLQKAKQEAEKKKEQESLPDVGDFRSPDNKYFTSENYGFQSPESYNKVIGSYPAGYVKPSTTTTMPGNVKAPISDIVSKTQTPSSTVDLERLLEKFLAGGVKQSEVAFDRQKEITNLYAQSSMERSRENTARQVELENIKRWREIGIAQIEAGTRSNIAFAQAVSILQQPNRNTMDALSTAFDAGAAPFAGRVRRG